jgi:hypothetical protein
MILDKYNTINIVTCIHIQLANTEKTWIIEFHKVNIEYINTKSMNQE